MHLKSLEIQGFKSFADRTVVQFDNNITSIVGPNGSGKSNISDAIRWVMGEMRTKELRGTKMEDVIFGGTQERPAMGFAEATLTLDNSDGAFRMDTPEIAITRRYYASGESEYYINRQSVRLKDINELFMDTGLGREGYSNIGQGKIDEIVSLKSTDRREIFEEAAGISKFRHRKEETERRLANTEDNLLRIGDKISELELQLEPLREQAEKAKKYLLYRDELRGLEVTVWLESLEKLAAAAEKAEADYNSAAFILEQQHSDLNQLYASAEQYNLLLNQMDLQSEAKRDEIMTLEGELQKQLAEISVLISNQKNNEEYIHRLQEELDDETKRSGGVTEQIAQLEARVSALQDELAQVLAQLEECVHSSEAQVESADSLAQKETALQAQAALLQMQLAEKRTQVASITASAEEVNQRKELLLADLTAAEERKSALEEQMKAAQKILTDAEETVTSAQNSLQGYALRREAREKKRVQLQEVTDDLLIQEKTINSRIHMLQEMQKDLDGFSQPVKSVLQAASQGKLSGVVGPVSELIKTDDAYSVAIETALGAALQNIVVKTEKDGKAGVQMLKQAKIGRATFLPLDMLRPRNFSEKGVEKQKGFVGLASDLLRFDPSLEVMVSHLLGTTVVCDTLDSAVQMSKAFSSRFRIVTLDGQLMNVGGSMTGGSANKNSGLLTRANALERLQNELSALTEKRVTAEKELAEAIRQRDEVAFQEESTKAELRLGEDTVLRQQGEVKQLQLLMNALDDNLENYHNELKQMDSRHGSDQGKLTVLNAEIAETQARFKSVQAEMASLELERRDADSKTEALQARITELKLKATSAETEKQSVLENISHLQELDRQMQGDRQQKESFVQRYVEENAQLDELIHAGNDSSQKLSALVQEKKNALQDFLQERSSLEQKRTRADKDAQEKNKEILLMERETARLEQKKATTALEEKQIIDKLWDSYELTRTTAKDVVVTVESMAAANRRISELRRKISSLGTPNLGAIDEFARISERYEYLTGQRDDVLHTKKGLEDIVRDITNEMKEIFVREFGRINTYFGQTFVEMFGGGKASLELEDPDEPLTTGIEIKVQPPGKQLKTITLLSGGEKAFVAIALYFAILKVRPTSFCLLDEIDAALDDRNVERFAGYLKNLSDKTQFIVITHRRGTMEASDALYGVTMQEHGISRILHINLNDVQEQLGIEV